jgi:hypothetical protein
MLRMVDEDQVGSLRRYIEAHTGSRIEADLFLVSHLSTVLAVRLHDGQRVVGKARPFQPRLVGCSMTHARLFAEGFPCPEPLGHIEEDRGVAYSLERYLPGGRLLPRDDRLAHDHARWLRRFVEAAPGPEEIVDLSPAVAWLDWDAQRAQLWPAPDDRAEDLNDLHRSRWIDELAVRAREVLTSRALDVVVGHGDWESWNLSWRGRELLACFDLDSVVCLPEAAIAGAAALVHPAQGEPVTADIEQTERFLHAYAAARGEPWDQDEWQVAWAASLWLQTFNAKKESIDGDDGPLQRELARDGPQRLDRSRTR